MSERFIFKERLSPHWCIVGVRTCQLMALSVRHCRASPSGTRMFRFCNDTRSARTMSMRGRRDLIHSGHKNLISFMYITVLGFSPVELNTFTAPFANGTQLTITNQHISLNYSNSVVVANFLTLKTNCNFFYSTKTVGKVKICSISKSHNNILVLFCD